MYTLRGVTVVTSPYQWLSVDDGDIDIVIPAGDDMLPYELRSNVTETAIDSDTGLQRGIRQRQQAATGAAPDSDYAIVPAEEDMLLPHTSRSFDSKISTDRETGQQQEVTADGVSEFRLREQAVTIDASKTNKSTANGVTSIGKLPSATEDTRRPVSMTAGPADDAARQGK